MKRAIFPGSFDPYTIGHFSIVQRALAFMDEIVIAIGVNEAKSSYFSLEKRMDAIAALYKDEPRVKVTSYDSLTTDFAKEVQADFILRGIRSVKDFDYEENIADVNRKLSGIETIVLFAEPSLAYVSSTFVRELLRYHKDITPFIPKGMKI